MAPPTRIFCADSNYLILATAFKRGDNMLSKAVRRVGQARRLDQRDFAGVKLRKLGFTGNRRQVRRHHFARENCNAEAFANRRKTAREARRSIGDTPVATDRLERIDRALAIDARLGRDNERNARKARRRELIARHPDQRLAPHPHALKRCRRLALDEHEIECAGMKFVEKVEREIAGHLELDERMRFCKS